MTTLKKKIRNVGVLIDSLDPGTQGWAFNYWRFIYLKLIDREYKKTS